MTTGLPYLLLLGVLVLAKDENKEKAHDDKQKIQGLWLPVSVEQNGKQLPEQKVKEVKHLEVKGDHFVMVLDNGEQKDEGPTFTFRLDPARKPKAIDLKAAKGPGKGKTTLGIYSLESGELRLCMAQVEEARPTAFSTKEKSRTVLMIFKRKP
jgi:uncharacterized protein (TIGR03067 family)